MLQVDYYGVVSDSADKNILKMAQDIFLNQLKSMDGVSVDDKRPDTSKSLNSLPALPKDSSKIAFYAEISGMQDSKGQNVWNCNFNAVNSADGIVHSKKETYESYYKILTGAKSAIETVLNDFKDNSSRSMDMAEIHKPTSASISSIDMDSLAGTWGGEPYTDKIIILRGGRGFVIFKNGATMNIKITPKNIKIDGMSLTLEIMQLGKSNASYYPELPREKALEIAESAKPIVWNFSLTSPGVLEGIKSTISAEGNNSEESRYSIQWTKQ